MKVQGRKSRRPTNTARPFPLEIPDASPDPPSLTESFVNCVTTPAYRLSGAAPPAFFRSDGSRTVARDPSSKDT